MGVHDKRFSESPVHKITSYFSAVVGRGRPPFDPLDTPKLTRAIDRTPPLVWVSGPEGTPYRYVMPTLVCVIGSGRLLGLCTREGN